MEINSLLFFFFVLQKALRCFPICFKICLSFTGYSFSGSAWWTFDYVIGPSRKPFYLCFGVRGTHCLAPSHTAAIWTPVGWGKPSWSLLLPTLLTPPARLFAIYAWWAWWYQSQSWVSSFLDFLLWGKKYLHQPFFLFFKQICINHFEHTFSNYNFVSWMWAAFFLQQPLWFAPMWRHRVSSVSPSCPPALLPSPGSLLSSLWVCFLSLPIHIPASLFFILQLKLLLQWALKLFWCSACCGNKLSLTPSRTACVLLMQYVVCVCMQSWYKKDCGLQERPGRCSKSRGVFVESSSCNSLRSCFNSVTGWLPTVCADYTDVSKAYILCSSLHVRINKDTWE